MVNFFDVATPEEVEDYFGEIPTEEMIAERRAAFEQYPDMNYESLFLLYADRGEPDLAAEYRDKIDDQSRKMSACMLAYELRD